MLSLLITLRTGGNLGLGKQLFCLLFVCTGIHCESKDTEEDIFEDIDDDNEIFPSSCMQKVRSSFCEKMGGALLHPPQLVSLVQSPPVPVQNLGAAAVKIKVISDNLR